MNTKIFSSIMHTATRGGSMLFGQSIKFNIKPEKEPTEKTGMIIRYCTASEYKKAEQEKRKVKWDSIGTLQKPIPFAKEYNLEIEEAKLEQETYAFSVRLVNDKKLERSSNVIFLFPPNQIDDYTTCNISWVKKKPQTKPTKIHKKAKVVNGQVIYE